MATIASPVPATPAQPAPEIARRPLDALDFFLAAVRDGLGPYLAIYLVAVRGPSHGWNEATAGMIVTIAGIGTAALCVRLHRSRDNAVARRDGGCGVCSRHHRHHARHRRRKGGGLDSEKGEDHGPPPSMWQTLTHTPALAIFALSAFAFHLANAAMLPSVGQLLAREVGGGQAASLIAACIVGAQLVMVPVAILVGRYADRWSHKPIFLVGFAVLALRGILYTLDSDAWWLLAVQLLDGIGAGIFGALFPVVIAAITRGSGRFNVSQGTVATVQGLGGAFSATRRAC